MNFGKWVQHRLVEIGKKATWLQDRAGLSRGTIAHWVTGSQPRLSNAYTVVCILADELGVNRDDLWNDVFLALEEQ